LAGFWINTLITFAKDAVKAFADFEAGLSRINTVAGVSEIELTGLWDEISIISKEFGIAKEELLDTAFNISSAGVEFQNVSKILRLSSVVALGAFTDTTTAFNGIIAVIKKFGIDLNESWSVAEKFFIANKLWQTTIEDLANAMQNLTSSVKPAGVKINEVFAILSTLTGVTWNANQVITQLNGAINAIAAPTTDASAKFKELGIEVGQGAIEQKGFVTVAKEVFDATNWNLELLRKLIPEVEAQKLIVALATTQNDKYKLSLDEVTNSQGNLQEAVNQVTNDTKFQLEVASRKYEDFKVRAWSSLISIFGFLSDFASILNSTLKVLGGFVALGVLSIGRFGKSFFDVFNDIRDNFSKFVEMFRGFSFDKLLKWQLTLPKIEFKNLKQSEADFKKFGGNLSKSIEEEFKNITDTISGNSKQSKLAVDELLEDIKWTSQSFGSAVWANNEDVKKNEDNINKMGAKAKEGNKEAEKLAKEAEKAEQERLKTREKFLKEKTDNEIKLAVSAQKEIDSAVKESEGKIKDYQKEIENTWNSFDKLKEKAIADIADIDNELWKLDRDRTQSIADRAIEIEKEIDEIKKKWTFEWDEYLTLLKLEKELALAKSNTSAEAIIESKRVSELNPTQLIIEEIEAEKLKLEAKKLSIETEIALAEEQKNKEIEILEAKVIAEQALIVQLWNIRVKTEEFVTKRLREETNKQIAITDKLIERIRTLIELKRQAWLSVWSSSTPSVPSTSWTNTNTNSSNIAVNLGGVIVNDGSDVDVIVNRVTEAIVEASQNANKWIT